MDIQKNIVIALGIVVEAAIGLILYDYHRLDKTLKMQDKVLEEAGVTVLVGRR